MSCKEIETTHKAEQHRMFLPNFERGDCVIKFPNARVKCYNKKVKNQLQEIGYEAELHNVINVPFALARSISMNAEIVCICEFCNKEFTQSIRRHDQVGIDCCYDKACIQKHNELVFELKHGKGITNPGQLEEVRNKVEKTCLMKFNATSPFGSREIIEKREQNNLIKYGTKNVASLDSTKEKVRNTFREHFNADNIFGSQYFRENLCFFLERKYGNEAKGVVNIAQIPSIRSKINSTLLENSEGTNVNTSKEQRHIKNLLNGKLNERINKKIKVDIVRYDLKIAYEIDGRGHFAYSKDSPNEFQRKELEREQKIFNAGFKLIRIVFDLNLIPDEQLLKVINCCNEYLLSHDDNKVIIDLRQMKIITLNFEKDLKEVIAFERL